MTNRIYAVGGVFLLGAVFASKFAYNFYLRRRKSEKVKQRREIHEVIMFHHGQTALMKSKYSRCVITPSMDRLLYYLSRVPKHNIDICMYVLTNLDIANALLKLNHRRVKIRVIVDTDMAFATGSHVRRLEKQGIPVRWMKSTNLMHHKFCLIDTVPCEDTEVVPLLMIGSLNWTNQALYGNWEGVVVTSQAKIVEDCRTEFERLWEQFTPIVS